MTEILIQKSTEKINILTKISYILLGILLNSTVVTISIKLLSTYGVWIGLVLAGVLSYLSIKKTTKRTATRLVAYGFVGLTIFYAITLILFFTAVAGF